jgi:hypothetical protein
VLTTRPGARFYYLRWVIHDWNQELCSTILSRLGQALEPGYSKILINESIVPEEAPSTYLATADLNMMSFAAGMERTEKLHQEYISNAGLKISGIWRPNDRVSECVIEVTLP